MPIICPKCGFKNLDNTYWCDNCKYKLIGSIENENEVIVEKKTNNNDFFSGTINEKEIPSYNRRDIAYSNNDSKLKIVSFVIFMVIIGVIVFAIISIFGNGIGFNWNTYDLPVDNSPLIQNPDLPGMNGLPDLDGLPPLDHIYPWDNTLPYWNPSTMDFENIAVFGVDYKFNGNTLTTSDGWTYTMNKRKEFTIDGIILDMRVYKPTDIISDSTCYYSFLDLFIGIDDLKTNPEDHPFTTSSYTNRVIFTSYHGDDNSYFKTHADNNHIIAHSQGVVDGLKTLDVGDLVVIESYITDFNGLNGNSHINWSGDDSFATHGCQVILVDAITINGQRYG